jgi:methylated-DNA-[protein]-cysteine S-methyltransferase
MIYDSEHCRKVYEVCKKIPKGETMSYKDIADIIHSSPRAVGQALKKNKNKDVPCHRVIHQSGNIGGFAGIRNNPKKIKILKMEGINIIQGRKIA